MAYTAPRTWVTGELVTAALLNTHLRDNVSFLANIPICRLSRSTALSLPDNAQTNVTWDVEHIDTDNMHSTVTNTGRITFNTAGVYAIGFAIEIAPAADYVLTYAAIFLNGTNGICEDAATGGSAATNLHLRNSTIYKFAAGDWISLDAYQDNTANVARNIAVPAGHPRAPVFWAAWQGLG